MQNIFLKKLKEVKVIHILFFVIILTFFIVKITKAITLEYAIPGPNGGTSNISRLSEYIRIIYNYGIYAGSVMAVIMISIYGFKWVVAGGNKSSIEKAKNGILTSITGLFLLFASYMILNTVNSQLTLLKMPHIEDIKEIALRRNIADGFDITSLDQSAIDESRRVDDLNVSCDNNDNRFCMSKDPSWTCINKRCSTRNSVGGVCDFADSRDCLDGLSCQGKGGDGFGRCYNLDCDGKKYKDSCIYYGMERKPLPGFCNKNRLVLDKIMKCDYCIKRLDFEIRKCIGDYECVGTNGKCGNSGNSKCKKGKCT